MEGHLTRVTRVDPLHKDAHPKIDGQLGRAKSKVKDPLSRDEVWTAQHWTKARHFFETSFGGQHCGEQVKVRALLSRRSGWLGIRPRRAALL